MPLCVVTYPSGRQVEYLRDTMGRVTTVRTRKPSTGAWSNIASGIVYQPLSLNVRSFTHGNGLATTNTHTLDYELSRCQVTDGALALIDKSYTRADKLNIIFYPILRAPRDRSDHRQRFTRQLARARLQQAEPLAERTLLRCRFTFADNVSANDRSACRPIRLTDPAKVTAWAVLPEAGPSK